MWLGGVRGFTGNCARERNLTLIRNVISSAWNSLILWNTNRPSDPDKKTRHTVVLQILPSQFESWVKINKREQIDEYLHLAKDLIVKHKDDSDTDDCWCPCNGFYITRLPSRQGPLQWVSRDPVGCISAKGKTAILDMTLNNLTVKFQ